MYSNIHSNQKNKKKKTKNLISKRQKLGLNALLPLDFFRNKNSTEAVLFAKYFNFERNQYSGVIRSIFPSQLKQEHLSTAITVDLWFVPWAALVTQVEIQTDVKQVALH